MLWIRLSYKEMEGMSTAVPPRPASVDANGENNDRHGLFVEAPLHGEHRVVMEPARDEQLLAEDELPAEDDAVGVSLERLLREPGDLVDDIDADRRRALGVIAVRLHVPPVL